jgi:hypothetical protein
LRYSRNSDELQFQAVYCVGGGQVLVSTIGFSAAAYPIRWPMNKAKPIRNAAAENQDGNDDPAVDGLGDVAFQLVLDGVAHLKPTMGNIIS